MQKLFSYFKIKNLGDILWSHSVNSKEKLQKTINNPEIMFIESDIRISNTGTVIAVHLPATESDLSFDKLMSEVAKTSKGIKLDFKDPEAVDYCLNYLQKANLKQPVILNADILQGNGANNPKFDANDFIKKCLDLYPQGILSLGWTTVADKKFPYIESNIKEMIGVCSEINNEILIPVRACLLPFSWENLQKLTKMENYFLTIWNNEPVDEELCNWIEKNTDYKTTAYDFINDEKESIKII